MTSRPSWAEYVKGKATRWLYLRSGAKYERSVLPPSTAESLLARLQTTDAYTLAQTHHILQVKTCTFIERCLPNLLKSATHIIKPRTETHRGVIVGKVAWSRTIRERRAGKLDDASFSTTRALRSADVPENQLLKWYLTELQSSVNYLRSSLGSGELPALLFEIGKSVNIALKEPAIREVSLPQRVTSLMRQRSHRNKNTCYRTMAELCLEYELTIRENRWAAILKLLSQGWLAPIRDDDLFELYALVWILETLTEKLDFKIEKTYGVIRPGERGQVAVLKRGDISTSVFFDRSPQSALNEQVSYYLKILKAYDGVPTGSSPRPDVLLVSETPKGRQVLLIEVKETSDDQYMRGSVYKVLGYLRDYRDMWNYAKTEYTPKAVLVFPNPLTPLEEDALSGDDCVLVSAGDDRRLEGILRTYFS